jgi:uncharacterized protein YcfJ
MTNFKNRMLLLASVFAMFAAPVFANNTYNTTGVVTSVQPQYRNVSVPVTVQDCQDVQVPVYGGSGGSTGNTIAGAIIGGAIGNQFGNGSGRDAMTVLGAIVGADVANRSAQGNNVVGYRVERQCSNRTVNDTRRELTDYRITYEVLGVEQSANVTTLYRVGDSIPVRVTVSLR